MLRRLTANIGRGLAAGLAGTAAMTASSTIEMKLQGRGGSDAPISAAQKVTGVEGFESDEARERANTFVHWAYGTGWGAARGVLGTFLGPNAADAAFFALFYGSEHVMMPALDIAPPATQWGAKAVATDLTHHTVYGTATNIAYRWLSG